MVSFSVVGLNKILEKLRNADLKKSNALGHAMASWLSRSARMRILKTKTAPDGTKWAPLAESTVKNLERTKAGGSMLYRTGSLHRAAGHSLMLWSKGAIILDDKMNYAECLQRGTKKMTARPYLGVSKEDHKKLKKLSRAYLKQTLNGE